MRLLDQYTAWPFWTTDSKELFYQLLNRGQDYMKILSADPSTGKNRLVYEEKQSTWVDWFEDLYILKNNKGFLLRSDIDGWKHLYYYDMQGKLKSRLTSGDWTVTEIVLVDEENEKVYFEGNKDNSFDTHLFVVDFDGNKFKKLTSAEGRHNCTVSENGAYFYTTHSNISTPPKTELYNSSGELH